MKCLHCIKIIEDGLWCSIECKRLFLISHYNPNTTIRTMNKFLKEKQVRSAKMLKEMREKGLTATDYIMGKDAFSEEVEK